MISKWTIERKRDGLELSRDEIADFIRDYTAGSLPDYQMAAFAMATYFRGMTPAETAALTEAMMLSGEVLDFSDWPLPTVDKHSTGGIGDKLSLIIAPLAAAVDLAVPMTSGRGLGITGGTLDKLESIPGFNCYLSFDELRRVVREVGCCMVGQSERLAPADRKLYALRDVTGTVPSIPLITASIMSKKLAAGAETIVFDVKCGRGAFMQTFEQAGELARSLLRTGSMLHRRMTALITDMDRPLGRSIGNSVEVAEAVATLKGGGPPDVRHLSIELTVEMALLAGAFETHAAARSALEQKLDSGAAFEIFCRMVAAQGGDVAVVEASSKLPQAAISREVKATATGYVADLDADALGRTVLKLGAGRQVASDSVDHGVGISELVERGSAVTPGMPLARIHAADEEAWQQAAREVLEAITLAEEPPEALPLVLQRITAEEWQ